MATLFRATGRHLRALATAASSPPAAAPLSSAALSAPPVPETAYALLRRGISPATKQPLAEISADIFGHARASEHAGPNHRSARKMLRAPLRGPHYASWYPKALESYDMKEFGIEGFKPLTDKTERRLLKLKQMRSAGKGVPKKGAGRK